MHLKPSVTGRLVGEFAIIVIGVLVALAVDDWNQYRSDRRLEAGILSRMENELVADGADLATADWDARARLWVLDAVLAELGDDQAFQRLTASRLDSFQHSTVRDSLRLAAGRDSLAAVDLRSQPLAVFRYRPEFDLSDDSYQEMVATGSLRIVVNDHLRASIMRYYRVAQDQGENEQKDAGYKDRLEDALASIGVAPGDDLTLEELGARARAAPPQFSVSVRRAQNSIRMQTIYYARIDLARRELETVLRSRSERVAR